MYEKRLQSLATFRFASYQAVIIAIVLLLSFCLGVPFHFHSHSLTLTHTQTLTTSRLHPLLTTYLSTLHFAVNTLFIYIVCRLQPTTYLLLMQTENAQPTVCNRFTLFACVSMDYIGVGCPYIPPKPVAQPFQIIFYIFPSVSSKIIIYISEKIFFEKNAYCLLYYIILIHRCFMLALYLYLFSVPYLLNSP